MTSPLLIDGQLVLHGTIGEDWFGDGIVATDVIQALAEHGAKAVTVRVNSGGGIATEGAAIHAALAAHPADVAVVVEGIAASAASIIAMAGKTITMRPGAVMMIHDPSGLTRGTVADHQKSIDALNAIADSMAGTYARRTGRTAAEERLAMVYETWMTAEDAVARGYADAVGGAAASPTAFNYAIYARAPQHLVAMARAQGWSRMGPNTPAEAGRSKPRGAVAAHTAVPEEHSMSSTSAAAAVATGTTPAVASESPEQIAARVEAALAARVAEINGLCKLAGFAAKAGDFIASGKSVDAIRAELTELRAAADKAGEVTARHAPASGRADPAAGAKVWDRVIARANARLGAAGMTAMAV